MTIEVKIVERVSKAGKLYVALEETKTGKIIAVGYADIAVLCDLRPSEIDEYKERG